MKKAALVTLSAGLLFSVSQGRVLQVAKGSGQYPTIQSAASVAGPGDTISIRGGIYRETVRPASSGTPSAPITFVSASGETATISATDAITGWVEHDVSDGKAIYKAHMGWTLNTPQNGDAGWDQVFVDGAMMVEARWPNMPDSADPAACRREYGASATAGSRNENVWTYSASGLAGEGDNLAGAFINTIPGYYWTPASGPVISSAQGTLTATIDLPSSEHYSPREGDYFFVWGASALLDHPREWWRATDGTLYLWAPASADPERLRVEAKRRQDVFDITDRAHISILDLHILGGGIKTNAGSHDLTIDNVDIRYSSHYTLIAGPWHTRGTGMVLHGANTVVRNSHIAYSSEHCLMLKGANSRSENNVVHDACYVGANGYVVGIEAENCAIVNTTAFGCGTNACIDLRHSPRSRVSYNDAYEGSRITTDGGMIMNARNFDGEGTRVSHNWIHDTKAPFDGPRGFYGSSGIYTEGGVSNYTIHHNIVWNVTGSGIVLGAGGEGSLNNVNVYNNTLFGENIVGPVNELGVNGNINNNICSGFPWGNFWGTRDSNIESAAEAGLRDTARLDFSLTENSPARDGGVVVDGITDGYTGAAPDIGALEYGRRAFIAGAVITARHIAQLSVTWDDTDFPEKKFTIAGMPFGRKLPADFRLKIGSAPAGGSIAYNAKTGVFTMADVSPGTLSGTQPIYGQIGEGSPIATGEMISLTPSGVRNHLRSRRNEPRVSYPGGQVIIRTDPEGCAPLILVQVNGASRRLRPDRNGHVKLSPPPGVYFLYLGGRPIRLPFPR